MTDPFADHVPGRGARYRGGGVALPTRV